MARVVKTDDDGRMVISGGRAVVAEGTAARGQLLRERLMLSRGDDPFRPPRGVPWDDLKARRVPATVAAVAAQEELEKEPVVVSADVQPEGDGFLSRAVQSGEPWKVWALRVMATVNDEQAAIEVGVEVPLG